MGIAVVIAVLLAATTAWLVSTARPPDATPDALGRVVQPLADTFDPRLWEAPSLPPYLGVPTGSSRAAPVGRFLGAAARGVGTAARGVATAARVAVLARSAFNEGVQGRLRERAIDFLRHPLDGLLEPPEFDLLTPEGVLLAAADSADDLSRYVRSLRALPLEVAILTAARDTGHFVADTGVDVGQIALRKRVIRGARGGRPSPPTTEPPPRTP